MPAPGARGDGRAPDRRGGDRGLRGCGREGRGAIADFYDAAGELLGCRPENVAFATSATDAFSRALSSVPFERGDTILTTRDDYISNQIAFFSLRERFGIDLVHAPVAPEGGVDVDAMAALMESVRPRLVVATHIPTNSGLVQPVEEIGQRCRELDLLYLVDACQSIGPIRPRRRPPRLRLPVRDVPEVPARPARHRPPLRVGPRARRRPRAALHRHARRTLDEAGRVRAGRDRSTLRGLGVSLRSTARSRGGDPLRARRRDGADSRPRAGARRAAPRRAVRDRRGPRARPWPRALRDRHVRCRRLGGGALQAGARRPRDQLGAQPARVRALRLRGQGSGVVRASVTALLQHRGRGRNRARRRRRACAAASSAGTTAARARPRARSAR